MAKESYPALLFYGREFYGDSEVIIMTLEQEAAYIRLIWLCWQDGSISSDHRSLAAMCKNTALDHFQADIWPVLSSRFTDIGNGRLIQQKVERIRSEKQERSDRKALAGKKGSESRWQKDGRRIAEPMANAWQNDSRPMAEAIAEPMAKNGNPISNLQIPNSKAELTIVRSAAGGREFAEREAKAELDAARKQIGWDEFWSLYPVSRKVKEKLTHDYYFGNIPDAATHAALMAGLNRWLKSDEWSRGIICASDNFLSQERWKEHPAAKSEIKAPMRTGSPEFIAEALRLSRERREEERQREKKAS